MGNEANPEKEWAPADHSFSTDDDIAYLKPSPNDKYLAVGFGKEKIRVFDVESNTFVMDMEGCCASRRDQVTINVDWSPDSTTLAYRWEKKNQIH
jgi:WD40 repeat protein